MTQEEKQLLLQDLSARLPYEVIVRCYFVDGVGEEVLDTNDIADLLYNDEDSEFPMYKPYLRPMSSMTEDEMEEFEGLIIPVDGGKAVIEEEKIQNYIEFCLKHHFDYRGLIPMGLALEAPENMYTL